MIAKPRPVPPYLRVTMPAHIKGDFSSPTAIEQSESQADASIQSQFKSGQGSKLILVIDDDPAVRDILNRVLVSEGLRCITAADGHDGLSKARSHHPDLIILDVLMPKVDGWSVLSSLKANPRLASIPVIMQSVKDDRDLGFMLWDIDHAAPGRPSLFFRAILKDGVLTIPAPNSPDIRQ